MNSMLNVYVITNVEKRAQSKECVFSRKDKTKLTFDHQTQNRSPHTNQNSYEQNRRL